MARLRLIASSKCDILLGVCRKDIALNAHIFSSSLVTSSALPNIIALSYRVENSSSSRLVSPTQDIHTFVLNLRQSIFLPDLAQ